MSSLGIINDISDVLIISSISGTMLFQNCGISHLFYLYGVS